MNISHIKAVFAEICQRHHRRTNSLLLRGIFSIENVTTIAFFNKLDGAKTKQITEVENNISPKMLLHSI